MNKQTTDQSKKTHKPSLREPPKPAVEFDRDKNEIYRPQDESIDFPQDQDTDTGGHLPDEDPYENPLDNSPGKDSEKDQSSSNKVWVQTNEGVVAEETKGEFIEGQKNRPAAPPDQTEGSPD